MGSTVQLTSQLIAGPATQSDGQFPSGTTNVNFGLNPPMKQINVDTGDAVANINSPSSYVTLPGVGTGGVVTQGIFLFVRCTSVMLLQVTFNNPLGSPIVSVLPIAGALVIEPDISHYITQIQVQGTGTLEYYAAGLQ